MIYRPSSPSSLPSPATFEMGSTAAEWLLNATASSVSTIATPTGWLNETQASPTPEIENGYQSFLGEGDGINSSHSDATTHALFLRTILMLSLMVASILLINILKMRGFHLISETSLYVMIGLLVGGIFTAAQAGELKKDIQLSSNFFSMVLLPPIIFEGGFTLQRVAFVRNLVPILMLAFAGAIYSTIVTSILMYLFALIAYPSFGVIQSLVFGSIISSTDPVSVLGLLPPSTDRNLYMLIFGESALNDAVAIILYRFFTDLAVKSRHGEVTIVKFLMALLSSLWVFVASATLGITIALVFAKLTKHIKSHEAQIFELLMFLVFAYSSYLITDLLGFTGIIGIFFCGVTMAHYAYDNLSKVTLLSAKIVLRTFSSMCDAFVFLYIGLGVFAFGKQNTAYNPGFIIVAFITILISRTHVFVLGFLHNFFAGVAKNDRIKIPMNHQIFLWYCGLRGAVSFALAVSLSTSMADVAAFPADLRALIFGTVEMVVVLTVLVLGGLVPYVMKWLKLDGQSDSDNDEPFIAGFVRGILGFFKMERYLPKVLRRLGLQVTSKEQEGETGAQNTPHAVYSQGLEDISKSSSTAGPSNEKKSARRTHSRDKGSNGTLEEYLQPERKHEDAAEIAAEAAEFMETMHSGFWMKLYELDKRYIKPFFTAEPRRTRHQGKNMYNAAASTVPKHFQSDFGAGSLREDVYQLSSANVTSALDDSDDEDELDRVSIAVAAEMIGIKGTTYKVSSVQPSAVTAGSSGYNAHTGKEIRSRTSSVTSLKATGNHRISTTSVNRKNIHELQSMNSPVSKIRSPPRVEPRSCAPVQDLENNDYTPHQVTNFADATQHSESGRNASSSNAFQNQDSNSILGETEDGDTGSLYGDQTNLVSKK